ncbi:MAG: S8 family serine peptidase [Cyanobacteria bacterium NC_groundwater_1444_Ag_S-0.65um_54_12]|nr:S8 family serine peptidase [Cyanobacteria bacterium NC_groundwater_1444_Ag_S-0.65um_54_12]
MLERAFSRNYAALLLPWLITGCLRPQSSQDLVPSTLAVRPLPMTAPAVTPPPSTEIVLALRQTESGGLKPQTRLELPKPAVTGQPSEIIVHFRDGQVHDIPGAKRLRDLKLPGTAVFRLASGGYSVQNIAHLQKDPAIAYAEPNYRLRVSDHDGPSDPEMDYVWGYYQIRTHKLWLAGYQVQDSVLVGVIDTGVDYRHPDLQDVVTKGANLVAKNRDPLDSHGHGTHVAGIIAAKANNGQGIAGVAAGAKIYAVKALDDQGEGSEADIADGIMDAVAAGARIINLSLGGDLDVLTLQQAIQEATRRGVLCVVAAGNAGDDQPNYPAAYPESLAVGATMTDDSRAFFSNYGSYVDVAAPGVLILSTLPGDRYDYETGTSMAAPHVAGAAALLLSRHPELGVERIRQLLLETGDPTTDFPYGKVPRINLLTAFEQLEGGKIAPAPTPSPGQASPPPLTLWYRAIATAYQLESTQENVDAFLTEVRSYEKDGTLGPGTDQAPAVRDLQRALTKLGHPVPVTGNFDAPTAAAVVAYKKSHGLRQSYRLADGTWAINEYVDPPTFNLLMAQLFSQLAAPR